MFARPPSGMRCMLSERGRSALIAILDNASLAQTFVGDLTVVAFTADRRTFYAVTRCLEIISEATLRLDQTLRDRHPHLPLRQIMSARNVYRHDYDNVLEAFV